MAALTSSLSREERVLRSTLVESNSSEHGLDSILRPPLPLTPPPPLTTIEAALCAQLQISENINCNPSTSNLIPNCNELDNSTLPISSDLILSEDDSLSSRRSSPSLLKYERKSPNRSENKFGAVDLFEKLPWHVMYKVFDTLELKDRVCASMVCKRWHALLTDSRFPLEDVVVLNIFERYVWKEVLSNNSTNRFQCVELNDFNQFEKILPHCYVSVSVKVWYFSTEFARLVLEKIQLCNVKMRCLDIYPYSENIGIEYFYEFLPYVKGITMRPHGLQHFFNGIDLSYFPNFFQLDTLNLDCINLSENVELPKTLTTLEWQSRNDSEFIKFLPKLERLKNLQFLLLGHSEFRLDDFKKFISLINFRRMSNLQYLLFKFVKFEFDDFNEQTISLALGENSKDKNIQLPLLQKLQFLKLDLCYCNLAHIISIFLRLTNLKLRIISLNVLSDEENYLVFSQLFDVISRSLHQRQIGLHLGLLQRDTQHSTALKNMASPIVTKYFAHILAKFEASFVSDVILLRKIFCSDFRRFTNLSELKFIQCDALTDELLGSIAANCLQLRKLCILNCTKCGETGIRHFIEFFHMRLSPILKIVWKRNRNYHLRPSKFFVTLTSEYKHLLTGLKYRFMCKVFGESNNGEAILIWHNQKRLFIQDYDEFERNRILGIVLPSLESTNNNNKQEFIEKIA